MGELLGKIPVLGGVAKDLPFVGDFFGTSDEQKAKEKAMQDAVAAYEAYRPEQQRARELALGQGMQAYAPANRMLGSMYGPEAQLNFAPMVNSPMAQAQAETAAQPPAGPPPMAGLQGMPTMGGGAGMASRMAMNMSPGANAPGRR